MNKKIVWICEWLTVLLALIGIITLGNVAHELYHYHDALVQNATVTSVCFLELPMSENNQSWLNSSAGHVETKEQINSPEWKAYTIGFAFMLILAIIMFIGFWIGE